jgi:hypothetical protein
MNTGMKMAWEEKVVCGIFSEKRLAEAPPPPPPSVVGGGIEGGGGFWAFFESSIPLPIFMYKHIKWSFLSKENVLEACRVTLCVDC